KSQSRVAYSCQTSVDPLSDERPRSGQRVRLSDCPTPVFRMPFIEAVRLALQTIWVQKLKSFFTLLGVMIGVTFLIAVVSIVGGMGRYMEDDFAGRLLGANTFTLRRYPWFGNNTTRNEWMEWQRRPRVYAADVTFIRSVLP